jgi:hypothetical protein
MYSVCEKQVHITGFYRHFIYRHMYIALPTVFQYVICMWEDRYILHIIYSTFNSLHYVICMWKNRYISQDYVTYIYYITYISAHVYSTFDCFALCSLYVKQVHIAGLHRHFIYSAHNIALLAVLHYVTCMWHRYISPVYITFLYTLLICVSHRLYCRVT